MTTLSPFRLLEFQEHALQAFKPVLVLSGLRPRSVRRSGAAVSLDGILNDQMRFRRLQDLETPGGAAISFAEFQGLLQVQRLQKKQTSAFLGFDLPSPPSGMSGLTVRIPAGL